MGNLNLVVNFVFHSFPPESHSHLNLTNFLLILSFKSARAGTYSHKTRIVLCKEGDESVMGFFYLLLIEDFG